MQVIDLGETLTELHACIERRDLQVAGVDGQGHPVPWADPALHDIRFISARPLAWPVSHFGQERFVFARYFVRVEAVLRPLLPLVSQDEFEAIMAEAKSEIIAGGRRHSMAGSFDQ